MSRKRIIFRASNGTDVPARVSANLLNRAPSLSICLIATDMTAIEASEEVIRQIREQKQTIEENYDELQKSREATLNLMEDFHTSKEQADAAEFRASKRDTGA